MKIKSAWAIQSLFLCFLFNIAFTAVICFLGYKTLDALNEWISPLSSLEGAALPEDVHTALGNFSTVIAQAQGYVKIVLIPLASAFTLLLWFFLFLAGGRQIRRAGARDGLSRVPEPEISQKTEGPKEEGEEAR